MGAIKSMIINSSYWYLYLFYDAQLKQELYCQEIVNECVSSYFEIGYQNAMKKPH